MKRRDITINAIAEDENGKIIDPCGGVGDLKNRVIRHVTAAFAEDPLRVLRVARFHARFASLGFTIAPETMSLLRQITASGELQELVPERVWTEVYKALADENPAQFFLTLRECGALQVLFPEIEALFGVPQRKEYHPEVDTGVHTMMVLTQAVQLTQDVTVRFAALVHDLGKAETPHYLLPRHIGHEERSIKPIKALCKRFKIPKAYCRLALLVARHHTLMHRLFELKPSTLLGLLEKLDAFRNPELLTKFILACEADARGRLEMERKPYPQAEYLQKAFTACRSVDPREFLSQGLQGAAVGEAIRQARIARIKTLQAEMKKPASP